jgi:pimeloyl-ACP methyl ester carboxylesterase
MGDVPDSWPAVNVRLPVRAAAARGRVETHLHARRQGDAACPRKVLFLHGVGITSATWSRVQPQVAAVADTAAVDLLGMGESGADGDLEVGLRAQVTLVDQALDALRWPGAVVVGHSMGGAVGLGAALGFPHRVRALVQVAGAGLSQPIPAPFRLTAVPGAELGLFAAAWLMPWLGLGPMWGGFWSRYPDTAREILAAHRRLAHDRHFVRATRDLRPARHARWFRWYPRLAQPVIVLHGRRDPIVPFDVAQRLAAILPHAELRPLPRAAHMPHESCPEAVVEAVRDVLELVHGSQGNALG